MHNINAVSGLKKKERKCLSRVPQGTQAYKPPKNQRKRIIFSKTDMQNLKTLFNSQQLIASQMADTE